MGLWSGIKYALNSRLGTSTFKSLDKLIDDVQSKTNDTYVQAQNANANAYEVRTRGMVKSIQRGEKVINDTQWQSGERTYSYTVNEFNPQKSILQVAGYCVSNTMDMSNFFGAITSENTFKIGFYKTDNGNADIRFAWQITEFY